LTGATRVSLDFPSSLTPFQRLMVHEIAERLGLSHESVGEVCIPPLSLTWRWDVAVMLLFVVFSLVRWFVTFCTQTFP
jgi:hypothetical protein